MGIPAMMTKYGGEKMGKFLSGIVDDINPLSISKARSSFATGGFERGMQQVSAINKLKNRKTGMTLSDYFSGKKIETAMLDDGGVKFGGLIDDAQGDYTRSIVRTVGAGTIAAYGLSPMILGEDNFVNRTVNAGANAAFHGTVASSLLQAKGPAKYAGMAYAGLAGVNAIRSGNNFGPF